MRKMGVLYKFKFVGGGGGEVGTLPTDNRITHPTFIITPTNSVLEVAG